jgi:hypothetical protein
VCYNLLGAFARFSAKPQFSGQPWLPKLSRLAPGKEIHLKIIDDVVERALAKMSAGERRDLILSVVERMLVQMSAPERQSLMESVVDKFLDGLPPDERRATVRELVPRLLAQMMQSGGMSVDELLWAAMGSLGALDEEGEKRNA